ncbi:hypothetical protein [Gallaecimonas xiamenensis]|uniref:Uncharacterized protein n=1 Tax=Gallaecimonas xiamenensis 3-C-1 TaxID=745411 RepID=K2KD53_9GAMM|nr:hypothetical protein [Gallaecimonas xiamenensis]EKE75160.1 hypothetical protein B3C1_07786 [Gallaecimonas xiamenensis 3-C-1]
MLGLGLALALLVAAYLKLVPQLARFEGPAKQAEAPLQKGPSPWALMLSQVALHNLGQLLSGTFFVLLLGTWGLAAIMVLYLSLALIQNYLVAGHAIGTGKLSVVAMLSPRTPELLRHLLGMLAVLTLGLLAAFAVGGMTYFLKELFDVPEYGVRLAQLALVLLACFALFSRGRWLVRYLLPALAVLSLAGTLAVFGVALVSDHSQWHFVKAQPLEVIAREWTRVGTLTTFLLGGYLALVPSLAGLCRDRQQRALVGAMPVLVNGAVALLWGAIILALLGAEAGTLVAQQVRDVALAEQLFGEWGREGLFLLTLAPQLALMLVALRAARLAFADALRFAQSRLVQRVLVGLAVLMIFLRVLFSFDVELNPDWPLKIKDCGHLILGVLLLWWPLQRLWQRQCWGGWLPGALALLCGIALAVWNLLWWMDSTWVFAALCATAALVLLVTLWFQRRPKEQGL